MSDRPIIFSGPMVRALLDGIKTQTRRILKPQPPPGLLPECYAIPGEAQPVGTRWVRGDRLWVREAFMGFVIADDTGLPVGDRKALYRATDAGLTWFDPETESTIDNPPWKPSIHMPRWASRLTLTVTDVRLQRLHDISEEDALAEGVESCMTSRGRMWKAYGEPPNSWVESARLSFARLWETIHGSDAWNENPWVVALTFTVEQRNIDATGDAR
jgi:hypothetical protein